MAEKLEEYKQKRRFTQTNEPQGNNAEEPSERLRFVVQHHIASRDHYDFRLELDGVLKSWAVPKGPSFDTHDKRLAVQVEDHPLDYRNFEGTIPQGEYGGGTIMIWDEGFWEPMEDAEGELKDGSLKFTLYGERLKGTWALVHMKPRKGQKDNNWLLIKERDPYVGSSDINTFTTSVTTGRTMEEIAEGKQPHKQTNDDVLPKQKKKAPKKNRVDFDELTLDGVLITHPNKITFPEAGVRKGDVAEYYSKVADHMMPFIENRLISSVRCPQGIEEACFFRKHPVTGFKGIGTVSLPDDEGEAEKNGNPEDSDNPEEGSKTEEYFYIKDTAGLISEVQLNTLEFHTWGSSVSTLEHPDTMVFDLDPDVGMTLDRIRQGVKDVKSLFDKLSLVSFLKTTGGKGYHVVVPFKPTGTWDTFKEFAQNVAKLMEATWPDRYTSNSRKNKRQGRIYVDWQRNIRGATSVAPYSLRAREGVTVSMPISWEELYTVAPNQITLEDALDRLHLKDPWEDYFEIEQEMKTD